MFELGSTDHLYVSFHPHSVGNITLTLPMHKQMCEQWGHEWWGTSVFRYWSVYLKWNLWPSTHMWREYHISTRLCCMMKICLPRLGSIEAVTEPRCVMKFHPSHLTDSQSLRVWRCTIFPIFGAVSIPTKLFSNYLTSSHFYIYLIGCVFLAV